MALVVADVAGVTVGSDEERDAKGKLGWEEEAEAEDVVLAAACPFRCPFDFCLVTFFPELVRPFSCRLL